MGYSEPAQEQQQLSPEFLPEPVIVEEVHVPTHIGTDGITISTGHWGSDIAIILKLVIGLYIGKKSVDRHYENKRNE